jgi:hypothetical protein
MTPASSALAYTGLFGVAQPHAALVNHHVMRFVVAAGLALGLGLSSLVAQEPSAQAQQQVEGQA